MQSEQTDTKSERERYSNMFRLTFRCQFFKDYRSSNAIYKDFKKTIQLYRQIYELSKTEQGRAKIFQIQPSIFSMYFQGAIQVVWQTPGYWEVDSLILKIVANLVLDERFSHQVTTIQSLLKGLPYSGSKNFDTFLAIALKNIQIIRKDIQIKAKERRQKQCMDRQQSKPQKKDSIIYMKGQKYPKYFSSVDEAAKELQKHPNMFNFPSTIYFRYQYIQYIEMLIAAMKAGARKEVEYIFPKSCAGCILFSMVMTGYQSKQKEVALKFLKIYSNGDVGEVFYEWLLSKIKKLYQSLGRNQNLTDPYQLTCTRFHSEKHSRQIFQFLSKLRWSRDLKHTKDYRKILGSTTSLQLQCIRFRKRQIIKEKAGEIRQGYRKINKKSENIFDISKLLSKKSAQILRNFIVDNLNKNNYQLEELIPQIYQNNHKVKRATRTFQLCYYNNCMRLVDDFKYLIYLRIEPIYMDYTAIYGKSVEQIKFLVKEGFPQEQFQFFVILKFYREKNDFSFLNLE